MNYKKIFKTRKSRAVILYAFRFLPDSIMLSLQYRIKLGRKLNLDTPQRFTEKLQWYKINYHNPIMKQCVDKYLVRDYVKAKGLNNILIPLIGKYDSLEHVVWSDLPNQFVIKTSHGGGGLNVIICSNKNKFSMDEAKEKLSFDLRPIRKNTLGREWAYYGLEPGIVVEKLLVNQDNPEAGINDYKFFCYNGHVKYIVVDIDRYIGHKRNFYNRDWTKLDVTSDCPTADITIEKPANFAKMIEVAEKLSSEFPFVRVDLYNVDGKIYFGELTFYPWSGYVQFIPDEIDFLFGEGFDLVKY